MTSRLPIPGRSHGLRRNTAFLVLLAAVVASELVPVERDASSGLVLSAAGPEVKLAIAVEPLSVGFSSSGASELEAKLVLFNPRLLHIPTSEFFAFISCDVDSEDYTSDAFQRAVDRDPLAVIFYSTQDDYCSSTGLEDYAPVFTTSDKVQARKLRDAIGNAGLSSRLFYGARSLKVQRRQNTSTIDSGGQGSALGPTPSTSVALIILYSITGVITALFLLIIVSGAIRAHRHPERYGPRATARFGQPRQSRAKGIARAVLDTLPIVRFSPDREDVSKPTDVEMNNREHNQNAEQQTSGEGNESVMEPSGQDGSSSTAAADSTFVGEEGEASKADQTAPHIPQLKCPVCMDDFEQGQELRVLPCQHSFHPDCIDPWLLNVSGSCPLCRNEIEHEQGESADLEELRHSQENSSAAELPVQVAFHGSRLSRYLDIARGTSGEERLAALRQLREENRGANGAMGRRRSLAPELGFTRLRQVFHRNRQSIARNEEQGDNTSSDPVPGSTSQGLDTRT